jgi:predicted RNase H-like nuclease (RuvC/YqgF family)
VGPEYIALFITAVGSAVTGGSWVVNKFLNRAYDRVRDLSETIHRQDEKIKSLEDNVNRMPLEYVLKVDFLREIQTMHDNFRQINTKLDKLMEKLLEK